MELDSQLVVQWVLKKAVPQWIIITQLGRLQQLITQVHNFKCSNVFREANCIADALSKHSHNIANPHVDFNNHQLPKKAKVYYQLDLLEMPNFRTKKKKRFLEHP